MSLAQWMARGDSKADPDARRAANTAMNAIDAMLRELHQLRSRLVGEIRVSDDAAAVRVDTLLAAQTGPQVSEIPSHPVRIDLPELVGLGKVAVDLLGIVRLSDFRENSVSPEQQVELMSGYAGMHGHRIVHVVHDDDVSGDFGPFHQKRATAEWLNERHAEYQGIITRKIDRVARNAEQTLRLLRWAGNRGKVLISVNDGIDTSTEAGKTMANFMAVVAEMELDAIKQAPSSHTGISHR